MDDNGYMSHNALMEQESMIAQATRRKWLEELDGNQSTPLICDESSDISKTEQLSFSVRHCDDLYKISEDFIGVMPWEERPNLRIASQIRNGHIITV